MFLLNVSPGSMKNNNCLPEQSKKHNFFVEVEVKTLLKNQSKVLQSYSILSYLQVYKS